VHHTAVDDGHRLPHDPSPGERRTTGVPTAWEAGAAGRTQRSGRTSDSEGINANDSRRSLPASHQRSGQSQNLENRIGGWQRRPMGRAHPPSRNSCPRLGFPSDFQPASFGSFRCRTLHRPALMLPAGVRIAPEIDGAQPKDLWRSRRGTELIELDHGQIRPAPAARSPHSCRHDDSESVSKGDRACLTSMS
jgi:hypothetical protein